MTIHIKQIGNYAVDFLLPPLCPATGEIVDHVGMVDPAFWKDLNFIHNPLCKTCGTPFAFDDDQDMACGACLDNPPLFNQNRSALYYDDGSRDIILRFKHGDQTHAVKCFTPWLRQAGDEILVSADIILPVPLHRLRLIKRRYNQADLIARDIAQYYPNATYYADGLHRVRNTLPQGHDKAKSRQKNIAKAFHTNPNYHYEGKKVVIIDDVYTSGSTLNECAKMLYRAGASEVNCLTLAKIVK